MNNKIDEIMQQADLFAKRLLENDNGCYVDGYANDEKKKLREMIENGLSENENQMNIENLQLIEELGASPDVHLANRFKVPDGYALIKREPDSEILQQLCFLVDNLVDHDVLTESDALAIYKFIAEYALSHNQD